MEKIKGTLYCTFKQLLCYGQGVPWRQDGNGGVFRGLETARYLKRRVEEAYIEHAIAGKERG